MPGGLAESKSPNCADRDAAITRREGWDAASFVGRGPQRQAGKLRWPDRGRRSDTALRASRRVERRRLERCETRSLLLLQPPPSLQGQVQQHRVECTTMALAKRSGPASGSPLGNARPKACRLLPCRETTRHKPSHPSSATAERRPRLRRKRGQAHPAVALTRPSLARPQAHPPRRDAPDLTETRSGSPTAQHAPKGVAEQKETP